MEASVVDLRYKMKDVLEALERREKVRILYHGKLKGTIIPASAARKLKVVDHPFFGMRATEEASVSEMMDNLRGGRHNAL
jgi:antitoxin (DNA-binding transcriptional repressor) of toxin-antitoxin stability system